MRRGRAGAAVVVLGVVLVTGCGAPEQPSPPPGQAAVLDPAGLALDRPGFRTDRAMPVDQATVCAGLQVFGPADDAAGCNGSLPGGNAVFFVLDGRGFDAYWNGYLSEMYLGVSHSRRQVLLDRYWAVELVDPARGGACTVAADLGTPRALALRVSSRRSEVRDPAASLDLCDKARDTVTAILTDQDPGGGSIVG